MLLGYSFTQVDEINENCAGFSYEETIKGKQKNDFSHKDYCDCTEENNENKTNQFFGIVKLVTLLNEVEETENKKKLNAFVFLDRSGSMSDMVDSRHSKLDYVKATFQRICLYMVEKKLPLALNLWGFDDRVDEFIPFQSVDESNLQEISKMINHVMPRDCTNIGKALDKGYEVIQKYLHQKARERKEKEKEKGRQEKGRQEKEKEKEKENYFEHNLFVLLTDGRPTTGTQDRLQLKQKLHRIATPGNHHENMKQSKTTLITIGCGHDIDGGLMRMMEADYNCVVDQFEHTGFVCGEFLDKVIHMLAHGIHLKVEHGEIYHWQKNVWTTELSLNHLVNGHQRVFHVRSATPELFTVTVSGISCLDDSVFVILNQKAGGLQDQEKEKEGQDLITRYLFRQETLELLSEIRDFNTETNTTKFSNIEFLEVQKSLLRLKLKTLLERMKSHMDFKNIRDSPCEEGKFMRLLCDDIVYAYRRLGKKGRYDNDLLAARQTSQGEQYVFNNTDTFEEDDLLVKKRNRDPHQGLNSGLGLGFNQSAAAADKKKFEDELAQESKDLDAAMETYGHEQEEDSQFSVFRPPKMVRSYTNIMKLLDHENGDGVKDEDEDTEHDEKKDIVLLGEDEDEDELFSQHRMTTWLDTPYCNKRTMTIMREVSSTAYDDVHRF